MPIYRAVAYSRWDPEKMKVTSFIVRARDPEEAVQKVKEHHFVEVKLRRLHGWRVLVHTGARTEVYGVLVGPAARGLWRARVLTYPRMLWSIPGGRGTIKFVGATPQDSERNAVEFILGFCNR